MQGKTIKCKNCGWVGTTPVRVGVNSGHSFRPVRYFCPDCRSQDLKEWVPEKQKKSDTRQ